MSRIGVFVCHCGINIAGTVDVERVAQEIGQHPEVVYAETYSYMCSEPGQQLLREAIAEHRLDGVVVAACSPSMHQETFRRAGSRVELNPYRCELANIREQCSWVHEHEPAHATDKAIEIVRTVVERVSWDEALEPFRLPVTKRALVVGGGIAGMQAALDIANAGIPVVLVERETHLGGKMAQLSGTYLNFTAAPHLLARKIEQVLDHPNTQVLTGAQVVQVEGYVGNFAVNVSGSKVSGLESDEPETSNLQSETMDVEVGAIVVATGWDAYPMERLSEYGGGEIPDVVDGLTFEEMLQDGAGPRRPSEVPVIRNAVCPIAPRSVVWSSPSRR
jgi:heterodisulfide reductase subunit A